MMRNPDPKPGRWVLPLVVLGMVLFTWVWINRLGPPEVDDTQPVSTTSATTTSTTAPGDAESVEEVGEPETTTTTLLPPEIEVYLENLADDKRALAEVVAELNSFNNEWEDDQISYQEAEDGFVSASEQALAFSNSVELHRPPDGIPGLADAHQKILDLATAVAAAADDALSGLRAPDTGELRRAAMVEFRAAAESFNQQVDQITEITLQGFGR